MKDALGVFHGTLAQMLLTLICSIALVTSPWWKRKTDVRHADAAGSLRYWFAMVTVLILAQLALGASMRHQHAGLAIPDFPMAYGDLWPRTDADSVSHYNQMRGEVNALNPITAGGIILQMTHRLMALVIVLVIAWLAGATLRRAGLRSAAGKLVLVWSALVAVQACLGAATIWTNKAADIATAHVAIGALCLVTGTLLTLIAMRYSSVNVRREDYFLTKEAIHSDARPVQINA
jgi:cytochrome c oxidase assembly protein subunit 15